LCIIRWVRKNIKSATSMVAAPYMTRQNIVGSKAGLGQKYFSDGQ
jgi:hypothetical protein